MKWPIRKTRAKKEKHQESPGGGANGLAGLVIFGSVAEAIEAEKVLREAHYSCKLVAPPLELRKGCDLAVAINLNEQPGIARLLKSKVPFVDIVPWSGGRELVSLPKITNYGDYTMVKVGNMKLTFDRRTGVIVNTSGGGCPDIPYLHLQLVGQRLDQAPRPEDIGFTLCALMLDRAWEEAKTLWKGGH
ncbi:MAG: DUF3343 domain-containing protein [Clostridia bacterium]|nr:DUF3343 domain-containing protein [Clostridia bacterium]